MTGQRTRLFYKGITSVKAVSGHSSITYPREDGGGATAYHGTSSTTKYPKTGHSNTRGTGSVAHSRGMPVRLPQCWHCSGRHSEEFHNVHQKCAINQKYWTISALSLKTSGGRKNILAQKWSSSTCNIGIRKCWNANMSVCQPWCFFYRPLTITIFTEI